MEKREEQGSVRVGLTWGGIGGVVGFLAALLDPVVGLVVGGFVGYLCGKRAALANAQREGALSGLIGGSVALPVFLVGACAGALVEVRITGSYLTRSAQTMPGIEVSPDRAWQIFLVGLLMVAVLQAMVFVGAATIAGALAKRS